MSRFRLRTTLSFAVLSVLALGYMARMNAQVLYGSIVGTVTDQAGASVPNAKVRITSLGTSQTREAETDTAGTYVFPSLPAIPTKSL